MGQVIVDIINQFLLIIGKVIDGVINYYNAHQGMMIPLIAGFILGRTMSSVLSMILGAVIVYIVLTHIPALTHVQLPNITPKIQINTN